MYLPISYAFFCTLREGLRLRQDRSLGLLKRFIVFADSHVITDVS